MPTPKPNSRKSSACAAPISSIASTPLALSRICFAFSAPFIPIETKSSWSAAAGIDCTHAGAERMRCSTISMSAVYCDSMCPENIPAPLVRNAGSPTDSAGLSSRLSRRSESTLTMVTAAASRSSGIDTGVPWKFAPV